GGAGDFRSVLADAHVGVEPGGEGDELGGGARMQAALVLDLNLFTQHQRFHQDTPARIFEATEIYLRPASCAASTAAVTSQVRRTVASLMSMGRFTPAITSTLGVPMSEIARFDGVPPNMSVSRMTPLPASTASTAWAMSCRRASMSSSGPMQMAFTASCGPTTCSIADTNSAASRPWVTSTSPFIRCYSLLSRSMFAPRPEIEP